MNTEPSERKEAPERIWTVGGIAGHFFTKQGNFAQVEYIRADLIAPPTTPSDAAMRAAEEIVQRVYCASPGEFTDLVEVVAAIITRHLAASSPNAENLVKEWISTLQDESRVTDEDAEDLVLRVIAFKSAATTSPEIPVGGRYERGLCSRHGEVDPAHRCAVYSGIHAGGYGAAPVDTTDNEGEIETRAGSLPLSLLDEIQERRETLYKGFGYEHYAPQMKTDLDYALAIAAALRTQEEKNKIIG